MPTQLLPAIGKVVFALQAGGKSDIFTANIDGSGLSNLTNQSGIARNPVWSPVGKKIAFSSETGIRVMNADGSGRTAIPNSGPLDFPVDWSPDGRFLLVESHREVNRDIFAVTLDGSQWINLSRSPAEDGAARWSPAGDQIAFSSDRESLEGRQIFQVYSLKIAGGETSRLSNFSNGASWPVWSPDGQELAVSVVNDAEGNNTDVYLLKADGAVIGKVTDEMGLNIPTSWSPDGRWVVINWRWGNTSQTLLEAADGSGSQALDLAGWGHRWQPGEGTQLAENLDVQMPTIEPAVDRPFALVNGTLIDGTGADPIVDAVVIIEKGKITAVGRKGEVSIPPGIETIDLTGMTILPGFIDAHVHQAYYGKNLTAWIKAGVTTVCDLGSPSDPFYFAFRDATLTHPEYARIVAAGPIVTSPGGYPIPVWGPEIALEVQSPEDARLKVGELLDKGADIIKIALAGTLTQGEVTVITSLAHERGTLVLAHVDTVKELELAVDNGVDIAAHMVVDRLPDELIQKMVAKDFTVIPTTAVMSGYYEAAKAQILDNLDRFVAAGGKVALGDDYGNPGAQLGMPIPDIDLMLQAGMTPMQVIVAGTKNAAHACNREQELGTLEVGKSADILIIQGDPLQDMHAPLNVQMVLRDGVVLLQDLR